MDEARWATLKWDSFRWDSLRNEWNDLLQVFEDIASHDITRRTLTLNPTRDSLTGWYGKIFTEKTVEGLLIPRASTRIAGRAGTYVRTDGLLITADGFQEGDEVKDGFSEYWEVKAIRNFQKGNSFDYRECDLTHLPLHDLSYKSVAPSVGEAVKNTRNYWEAYLDGDNLQNHSWITCYDEPDYPLVRVFKDMGIHIIFSITAPNSTPLIGHDQVPVGYKEHVPTHVLTLDRKLQWVAEAELRRITQSYPTGSQRSLERRSSTVRDLGSARLYDTEFILNYRRGTT